MRRTSLGVLLCASLAACAGGSDDRRADASFEVRDAGPLPDDYADQDEDGLCDGTERELGSRLDEPDSDGDGVPDLVELIYGFGANDPTSPADEQLVRLEARPGAEARLTVRFTVDGKGGDYIGYFEDIASPYDDGSSAGWYLESSQAISSEPPEAARVVEGAKQRFRAVLGPARLELELLFRAGDEVDPETCARAYPFRYGMREDGAGRIDERLLLLIVASTDADQPEDYCQPALCL